VLLPTEITATILHSPEEYLKLACLGTVALNQQLCDGHQKPVATGYPDAETVRALASVYRHCLKQAAAAPTQHRETSGQGMGSCNQLAHLRCACCCKVKMRPLLLRQHRVDTCPAAATSFDCNLPFAIESRKIFITEKASRMPEKDDTVFTLLAATGTARVSIPVLLRAAGQ